MASRWLVSPVGDALRKVGRLVRTTRRWKAKWRPIIERSFHSLKHSPLNQHFRGLRKVRLHASLRLTYCATIQMDRMK